jgi:hypothetical protein
MDNSMSKELKLCRGFVKASTLMTNKRRKIRKKNCKRRNKIFNKMMKRYGCIPLPKEWQ